MFKVSKQKKQVYSHEISLNHLKPQPILGEPELRTNLGLDVNISKLVHLLIFVGKGVLKP